MNRNRAERRKMAKHRIDSAHRNKLAHELPNRCQSRMPKVLEREPFARHSPINEVTAKPRTTLLRPTETDPISDMKPPYPSGETRCYQPTEEAAMRSEQ
ncbi:MAG: hypothetical protein VYA84_07605, partial [Planctomycetota bacterium]|nr:hypothetical protein [Planctomycetota bacterium]